MACEETLGYLWGKTIVQAIETEKGASGETAEIALVLSDDTVVTIWVATNSRGEPPELHMNRRRKMSKSSDGVGQIEFGPEDS